MSQDQYTEFYRPILGALGIEPQVLYDLGCGAGMILPLVSELWPNVRYLGLDASAEMIDYCQHNHPDREWFFMDDYALPLGKADVILCHSVFTHISLEDTKLYLRLMREHLSPHGRISASIHVQSEQWSGDVTRVDIAPAFFEELVSEAGLKVLGFYDTLQRYYRLSL